MPKTDNNRAEGAPAPMRSYEVGIKGYVGYHRDGKKVIDATSAGKAKYQFILDVSDAYDVTFKDLSCRVLSGYVRPLSREEMAWKEADAFNARYPIGTMVRYWSFERTGEPTGTAAIRHEATVVCEHAVAWMAGVSSCHSLSHVEAIATPEPPK